MMSHSPDLFAAYFPLPWLQIASAVSKLQFYSIVVEGLFFQAEDKIILEVNKLLLIKAFSIVFALHFNASDYYQCLVISNTGKLAYKSGR